MMFFSSLGHPRFKHTRIYNTLASHLDIYLGVDNDGQLHVIK